MDQINIFGIDILFLSRSYVKNDKLLYSLNHGFNIVKIDDELYGMHLYMVNGKGANKILGMKEMDPYKSTPCDVAIGLASKYEPVYALIKYDVTKPDAIAKDTMGYAKLSSTMSSSTEEYFCNIKEQFNNAKKLLSLEKQNTKYKTKYTKYKTIIKNTK